MRSSVRAYLPACMRGFACFLFPAGQHCPSRTKRWPCGARKKIKCVSKPRIRGCVRRGCQRVCMHSLKYKHTHTHTHVSTCWFGNLHFCMCAFTYWKAPQIISCVLHVAFMDPRSLLPLLPPSHPLTLKLCLSCLHVLAFTPSL